MEFKEVGQRIKKQRIKAGYSRKAVSEQIGIGTGTIYKIESGVIRPYLHHVVSMAKMFNCELDDLIFVNANNEENKGNE